MAIKKGKTTILNERAGISPEMAIRLSKAFGTSAESWLNQQSQYDLWVAEKSLGKIRSSACPRPNKALQPTANPLRRRFAAKKDKRKIRFDRSPTDRVCSSIHTKTVLSVLGATRATGGGLALTRPGFAPGKKRQASLGALICGSKKFRQTDRSAETMVSGSFIRPRPEPPSALIP
ncbi:HigA family addiction module antitoxin [Candidatus Thiosymbion oneisti]|uniref:HigA family addiction module antitoxin n=1 Tax=Candidatus Thiosymbion oneisti TaxID=589554 RepID=UPI00106201C6